MHNSGDCTLHTIESLFRCLRVQKNSPVVFWTSLWEATSNSSFSKYFTQQDIHLSYINSID